MEEVAVVHSDDLKDKEDLLRQMWTETLLPPIENTSLKSLLFPLWGKFPVSNAIGRPGPQKILGSECQGDLRPLYLG